VGDLEQTLRLDLKEIQRASSKRPALVILQGQPLGLTINLDRDHTIIGRGSKADVVLMDEVSSRLHAEIIRFETQDRCAEYFVNDLGSTNGTFLNGSRVKTEQLLQDGDKIKIGSYLMKFALLDEFEAEFQERLHHLTVRDELTGLRSRRSLFADLDRVVNQAAASAVVKPVSVLMMDLDFFKKVNDARGHLVGSNTIKEVGRIIRDIVGSDDLAARYGGEEFLAYALCPRDEGLALAERIRKEVEAHSFSASTNDASLRMRVTISLGVAAFPMDGVSALDLMQKADLALYRAKRNGRNRTCLYDVSLDKPDHLYQGVDAQAIMYGPAEAQ
jgi:diguanylate cyclase (GGDEF)-like protein